MFTFRLFLIIVDETNNGYYFSSPISSAALNQMRVDFNDQIVEYLGVRSEPNQSAVKL